MIKKISKRLKKAKKVKDLVPDNLAEKAEAVRSLAKKNEPTITTEVPKITNETIAAHREEVLKGARKYIYPLQHSKHRIIVITSTLAVIASVAFLIYCLIGLYQLRQHNTFLYRVTQVVPLPIARVQGSFVEYENYLFELRHYIHYYQNQLEQDFSGEEKQQLVEQRKQALEDVINDAYVKKLARQHKISVSNKEVNARIAEVREQNRLGNNDKVLADVLREYWGWSIADFKRSLKQQILEEKVMSQLDPEANKKAQAAMERLKAGADFAALAKEVSEDETTKANGGDFGFAITKSNPNIPPQIVTQLFALRPGQYSAIINTGQTLEIVKVLQGDASAVTAQRISFKVRDLSSQIEALKKQSPPKIYVNLD